MTPDRSTEQLQEQIEGTREELADTVDALAAKADVKTRAKEKAARIKQRATASPAGHRALGLAKQPRVQAGAGAMLAAVTALLLRRRRA